MQPLLGGDTIRVFTEGLAERISWGAQEYEGGEGVTEVTRRCTSGHRF